MPQMAGPQSSERRARGLRIAAWVVFGFGLVALRLAAVYSESGNWDEFALLQNAAATRATGELHSGGRGGLAVLSLLPLLGDCDEIAVLHRARLAWLVVTGAGLAALACLVAQIGGSSGGRWRDAGLAVALWAGVPATLTWSLQVRTDQLALTAGLWAAVAGVSSRRRRGLSLVAGALLALGYLATPKVVYVAALAVVLAVGEQWLARSWSLRREIVRAAGAAAAVGVVLAGYWLSVTRFFPAAGEVLLGGEGVTWSHGASVFELYRSTIGYSQYRALLPTLLPHALLLVLLVWTTLRALRDVATRDRRIGLAWAVAILGLAVGLFHAAAFEYFWMTLGLFPAIALAIARQPVMELFASWCWRPRLRHLAVAGFWLALAVPAGLQSAALLSDTQEVQRSSLDFVQRNFTSADHGFQPEGALFCRAAEEPFPTYFSQTLYYRFGLDEARRQRNIDSLLAEFRTRPVKFMLESWRLRQFPPEVQAFWASHYQPYHGSVFVAGRRLEGRRDGHDRFELLVEGAYRWLPYDKPSAISIDGVNLAPGQEIRLARGTHTARYVEDVPLGLLTLAVADLPSDSRPFYRDY